MAGMDYLAQDSMMQAGSARVAVIGGGCAGLAAAAGLAEAGIAVSLFEASPMLGGRARGLPWKGRQLDNGQHILLGAYGETLALLQLANVNLDEALLRLPLQMRVHGRFELHASASLPAPLHIVAGIFRAAGLTLPERLAIIRFMLWMRRMQFQLPTDEPLQRLLERKAQPAKAMRFLWEPLCLAALNTPIVCASAQIFLNVLRDSFTGSRADSDMLLPRRDLSALLADPLAHYIRHKNGDIRVATPVSAITADDDGFLLQIQDRQSERFSHVVSAVSPFRLAELVQPLPQLAPMVALCKQFEYQPIYTVYLQYADSVKLPGPMLALALAENGYSQWLFDRGRLCGQHGLIAVVISAEGSHQRLTQQELAAAVSAELQQVLPELGLPLWHKVIAEKRATFACTHGLARPGQTTPLKGLFLAGDYTVSDYPATIEGAVRSGTACAQYIIAELLHLDASGKPT